MSTLTNQETALLARRDELRIRLKAIAEDYKQGLSADSEERASELENAEVLDGIARITAEELKRIEAALEELEKSQHKA